LDNKLDIYAFREVGQGLSREEAGEQRGRNGLSRKRRSLWSEGPWLRGTRTTALVSATQRAGQAECGLVRVRAAARQINGCTFDSKQEPDALVAHVRIRAGAS